MRAIERAGSTNNIAVIKQLEQLKVSARPHAALQRLHESSTHHLQQTIYMARRNEKPVDKTDLFEIVTGPSRRTRSTREDDMACKLETYEATPT